jgi:hypothetical protein
VQSVQSWIPALSHEVVIAPGRVRSPRDPRTLAHLLHHAAVATTLSRAPLLAHRDAMDATEATAAAGAEIVVEAQAEILRRVH